MLLLQTIASYKYLLFLAAYVAVTNGENPDVVKTEVDLLEPVLQSNDSDIIELSNHYDIAIPQPLKPWSNTDDMLLTSCLGQLYLSELLTEEEVVPDFRQLTNQQRVYKVLFQKFAQVNTRESDEELWNLFQSLESRLYPWIHTSFKSALEIPKATKGSGIVMSVGDHHYAYAVTAIRALREVLKTQLPIEIFYIDDKDLSPTNRLYLETEFANVKTRDISTILDNKRAGLGGWSIKPFAILASSFTEVIMMDADVFFFRKPDDLLKDPAYIKTGSLFFYERTVLPNWTQGRDWLLSFLPSYSTQIGRSRWWNLTSSHEQEAGVVVINKSKSLLGLLSSCKMNAKKERDEVTYKHVLGDKETFWVGYEVTQTPYAFIKSYGTAFGGLAKEGDTKRVCGNQLHLGTDGRPFWWNGGLSRDKLKHPNEYTEYTHFAIGNNWEWPTSCVNDVDNVQETTPEERNLVKQYIQIEIDRKKEESMAKESTSTESKAKQSTSTESIIKESTSAESTAKESTSTESIAKKVHQQN